VVGFTHALALVCFRELRELVILLQFAVHDCLDALHVFGSFGALELLVAEECILMEDLSWSRSFLLVLEFTNSGFKIFAHDSVRLRKTSFSQMMSLVQ
jgi:hypothetical protein